MTSVKKSYTPYSISCDSSLVFSIPLYQRLFEWGDEQIKQLLDDLVSAKKKDSSAPYYIGMLTAKANSNVMELVDGQQRFTAMVLLGLVFKWDKFLVVSSGTGETSRLQFFARDNDKKYLAAKIKGRELSITSYKNTKMERGISFIQNYLKNVLKLDEKGEADFGNYVFHHLTFFLSCLPSDYNSNELNTYFERMNTSGKSLENYEILKVDILRRLTGNKELYTALWNSVSIVEKKMLRHHQKETTWGLRNRYKDAIINALNNKFDNAFEHHGVAFDENLEDSDVVEEDQNMTPKTIEEIAPSSKNPFKIIKRRTEEHSPLTFPELLLQVLYICLDQNIDKVTIDNEEIPGRHETEFFDTRKLGETFKWAFDQRKVDPLEFINKLALYRLLLDFFIIRIDDEDDEPYPFTLYDADQTAKASVKMYLSMLYSASSAMTYYKWLPDLLLFLEDFVRNNQSLYLDAETYLEKLKEIDNKWHPESDIIINDLCFERIDRYWFWRFDYYLWENRALFFKNQSDVDASERYIFRRNRSIEHIAPQHPSKEFDDKKSFHWNDENLSEEEKQAQKSIRDCLGNMVMISSGQNSSLSNSCFEIKQAVVKRYMQGKEKVESLKMLYVYSRYGNWSIENIQEHDAFSLAFLKGTYDPTGDALKELV